jgi:hypothetical protein
VVEYMNYSCTRWPGSSENFSPFVSILELIAYAGPFGAQFLVPATKPWREFLANVTSNQASGDLK